MTMLIRQGMSAFQHTAARRRLAQSDARRIFPLRFNTQPPEGGWMGPIGAVINSFSFNTQPPEGGWSSALVGPYGLPGFNTQPPEGGWSFTYTLPMPSAKFQHTAARRRLGGLCRAIQRQRQVSTHSRPKAAGLIKGDGTH